MTNVFQAGGTGIPLPGGEIIIRLIKASKDGKALETHFALSGPDKQAPLKSISVWAEKLTTPEQACEFMGEKRFSYEVYCRLHVDNIRNLTLPELPEPGLDTVWDTLFQDGTAIPDPRPGAHGHSGIIGLERPPEMEKKVYKALRTKLADLANEDLRLLLANQD